MRVGRKQQPPNGIACAIRQNGFFWALFGGWGNLGGGKKGKKIWAFTFYSWAEYFGALNSWTLSSKAKKIEIIILRSEFLSSGNKSFSVWLSDTHPQISLFNSPNLLFSNSYFSNSQSSWFARSLISYFTRLFSQSLIFILRTLREIP